MTVLLNPLMIVFPSMTSFVAQMVICIEGSIHLISHARDITTTPLTSNSERAELRPQNKTGANFLEEILSHPHFKDQQRYHGNLSLGQTRDYESEL
jgi:hypothetical protein